MENNNKNCTIKNSIVFWISDFLINCFLRNNSTIIYSFIILGMIFWLVDTLIDYLFYYQDSFLNLLLFEVPGNKLFTRLNLFIITLITGLIIYRIKIKKDKMEKKYSITCENLEEELQEANRQLITYNKEITTTHKDLDKSVKKIKILNERFVNMINVISNLEENYRDDEESFLSDLLQNAIDIVPEADYGAIYVIDKDNKYRFIDTIGHNIDILKNIRLNKEILYHNDEKGIFTSGKYSLDLSRIPFPKSETVKGALKPVSKSIFINITVEGDMLGRIVLGIDKNTDRKFSQITKKILQSFEVLASSFFFFQRFNKLQGQFTKELITSIIQMMGLYDKYTSGHSENVALIASEIAEIIGLPQKEVNDTYWAGMVHDIGKLLIPYNILNKKGRLTDQEYILIKKHPVWGFEALSKSETLKPIATYVLFHHERWDGRGYPEGIKGNEIPLISQILAVADAWDAMTSKRSYRNPLSQEEALQEIENNKGTQFAPEVVEAFLRYYEEVIYDEISLQRNNIYIY